LFAELQYRVHEIVMQEYASQQRLKSERVTQTT